MVQINIPPAHHMTEPGALDPAAFSLMGTDVGGFMPHGDYTEDLQD